MSALDKPGSHFPPNYWDAIVWQFQELLGTAYEPIMADTLAPGDLVIVMPPASDTQHEDAPVSVGRVTEVNFADSAREGQNAGKGGWLIKVRDMRPDRSTQENEYGTDAYEFYRLDDVEMEEPEGE